MGLKNPLMWAYYANRFKGIAIEVKVPKGEVIEMVYNTDIPSISNAGDISESVRRILTAKLQCWQHENEYRFLKEEGNGPQKIGKITAVYFGAPYANTTPHMVEKRHHIKQYKRHAGFLRRFIENKNTSINGESSKITCRCVDIEGGQVVPLDCCGRGFSD